jgi:hypothetical protein
VAGGGRTAPATLRALVSKEEPDSTGDTSDLAIPMMLTLLVQQSSRRIVLFLACLDGSELVKRR